ncbi:hypothetical protein FA95DRAFT_1584339 [Auriscalpium vulgare]|uniref:Uncharacterized protein n=1 Tax=Auriscalpium vulgare TaxID=40419 RepID=A0ACB8RF91_9AGAM|nr:hypothetical protein FA95DRAFT_1584339 [Auriscalpium vulgare]
MPSILNLKFKGNKSFIAFSNLGDADSLTKTWKVCTKVASFLEQGQRLENLSWRLWHLQNLMVDTDNAKSKREFKKLSKCMSDKLDKEKGRSIEELEAPGFKRNHSTDIIRQRAAEKERSREANQSRPGTIGRMQFTFSVDQPAPAASAAPVQKPDLKPSAEFKDNAARRGRPSTRSMATENAGDPAPTLPDATDKDPPLTQRGRKTATSSTDLHANSNASDVSLRFPSLFSNDFGPTALLYPTPTLANGMSYGEDVRHKGSHGDTFSIMRPTIELPLDELLVESGDSPGAWSLGDHSRHLDLVDRPPSSDQDIDMKPAGDLYSDNHFSQGAFTRIQTDVPQQTVAPSKLGPQTNTTSSSSSRPSLSVRTQGATTRSSGPSATATNPPAPNSNNNSAPGGVKAECSNCGATHTPLWRRGLNDELNCNACGLYCKLHKRPRPKSMRNSHGEGRSQAAPRQESSEVMAQCYNCHTTATPLWRKDDEGKTVCNAFKLHGSARPISMKSDVIRKRSRHDARRAGNVSETPSASPGASRRATPNADGLSPTLAPDSTTSSYDNGDSFDFRSSTQSELVGALGGDGAQHTGYNGQDLYFPGPYHPDYLSQLFNQTNEHTFAGETSDADSADTRRSKRRRMSSDSATDPPSSAVSYSSFGDSFSSSGTSATSASHSQRSSMEFPFASYTASYNGLMRGGANAFWHPPMLPQTNSPQFIHPPMLPPDESPMDFLHPPMLPQEENDSLFATYLHPPMLLPDRHDDREMNNVHQPHPPMFPNDWSNGNGYPENSMRAF